ncbi:MAG: hypothetical protein ACMXYD_00755 [Candidatus Woesearchaeota archaeon]
MRRQSKVILLCACLAALTYFAQQNRPIELTQENIDKIVQVQEAKKTYVQQMAAINQGVIETEEHEKAFIQLCINLSNQHEKLVNLGISKQELTGVAGACTYIHNAMIRLIDFRKQLENDEFTDFREYSVNAWTVMNSREVNGLIIRLKLLKQEDVSFPYYKKQLDLLQKEMLRVGPALVNEEDKSYSYLQLRQQARSAYSRLSEYINEF